MKLNITQQVLSNVTYHEFTATFTLSQLCVGAMVVTRSGLLFFFVIYKIATLMLFLEAAAKVCPTLPIGML